MNFMQHKHEPGDHKITPKESIRDEILDLHNSNEQKQWIDRIRECDWGAAKLIADLLEQDNSMK